MPAIALSAASQARWISDWVRVLFLTLADSLPILISNSESKTTPGCQRSIVISGLLVDHNAIGSDGLFLIRLNQVLFISECTIFSGNFDISGKMEIELAPSTCLDNPVSSVREYNVNCIPSLQSEFQHINAPAVNVRQFQYGRPEPGLRVLPGLPHHLR